MSFYLYLNIAIIAFPLIFSFHPKIKFYKKIKPVLFAFLIIGILFVAWDSFATSRGHWSFNPEYVNEMRILGIPIEEILFFITVPYSCLFVFESINHFLVTKNYSLLKNGSSHLLVYQLCCLHLYLIVKNTRFWQYFLLA